MFYRLGGLQFYIFTSVQPRECYPDHQLLVQGHLNSTIHIYVCIPQFIISNDFYLFGTTAQKEVKHLLGVSAIIMIDGVCWQGMAKSIRAFPPPSSPSLPIAMLEASKKRCNSLLLLRPAFFCKEMQKWKWWNLSLVDRNKNLGRYEMYHKKDHMNDMNFLCNVLGFCKKANSIFALLQFALVCFLLQILPTYLESTAVGLKAKVFSQH